MRPTPSPAPSTDDNSELDALLHFVAHAAVDGLSTADFLRAFQADAEAVAPMLFGQVDDPLARRALIGQFGRALWSTIPQPSRHWRPVPVPKPERNDLCPCGSGKKFKQCCQPFEAPIDMFSQLNMLKFVLDLWPDSKMAEVPLHRIDPDALADTAKQWVDEGDPERAIRLLQRLFDDIASLDERHIWCFDSLCDAYVEAGEPEWREDLVQQVSSHRDRSLASAALQRATTMASDEGDFEKAWEHFGRAMRLAPDDHSLAHLEVLVLNSEGRLDEAKARAAFWATRLRRMDRPELDDLIEFLEETSRDPDRAMLRLAERNRSEDSAWSDLLDTVPPAELLYEIESGPMPDGRWGSGRIAIAMRPLPALARIERDWSDRFFVQKPGLVGLQGDAAAVCDQFDAVMQFMRDHPAAWQSFGILDDLTLIARDWFDGDVDGFAESTVIREITARAVELLERCVAAAGNGTPTVEWGALENRPVLRLVAQRIDALLQAFDSDEDQRELDRLQEWMLELNPTDNHGYRNVVAKERLWSRDVAGALALVERYPDDAGDMPFDLALALFLSGDKDRAAEAWSRGAHATPLIAATLLAANPKPPDPEDVDDGYEIFGAPAHAWRYRSEIRELWQATGALAWAKKLPRVPVPKRKKAPSPRRATGGRASSQTIMLPGIDEMLDETTLLESLAERGFAVAPVHGLLSAVTLSPAMSMPSQWLNLALEYRDRTAADIDDLNAAIVPLMGLYNSINSALRMKRGIDYFPSAALPTDNPAQATEWARGFMRVVEQGRAAWRDKTTTTHGKSALTAIERVAAGIVSDDRLRQEAKTMGVDDSPFGDPTWHDVLAAATRVLAAA